MTEPGQQVRCRVDPDFADALSAAGGSVLVSTYQANKLVAVGGGVGGGRATVLLRDFDKPMGIAVAGGTVAVGTRDDLVLLADAPHLAVTYGGDTGKRYDGLLVPRVTVHTGDVAVHDVGLGAGGAVWFVNTRFGCVCRVNPRFSFEPVWRPPFTTGLAPEDRCHLNGMATVDGRPRYVTCLGETDTPGGWRPGREAGGCVIDVETDQVIVRGLCLPHSPRWHDGQLWVLNSGRGELLTVDTATGRTTVVAMLPAYVRGLDVVGPYAFVGLSSLRDRSAAAGGLPVQRRSADLLCGVAAVDLRTGTVAGLLRFTAGVTEVFDVRFWPGVRRPMILNRDQPESRQAFTAPHFSYWIRPGGRPANEAS